MKEPKFHPCGCSVRSGNMRRTPEGTFVEVSVLRTEHAETCKFKRSALGEPIAGGVMARGADGDIRRDMLETWSTSSSSPNGPIQITWNLDADPRFLDLTTNVLNYPEDFWRKVWRKRKAELDKLK